MAADKKTKKTTTTKSKKTSTAKINQDESQNQGPGFGIEKLFLKDVSV